MIFHVFSLQSAWKEFGQEKCGVSLQLRGKTPQQPGPGDFKTCICDGQQIFVTTSICDELMEVEMETA